MGALKNLWDEWAWALLPAGFVVLCGLGCYDCFYGTPGPDRGARACILDAETLQYRGSMSVSGVEIPVDRVVSVGEYGSVTGLFVSVEPLEDGMWRATFKNTHTGEEAEQILASCTD